MASSSDPGNGRYIVLCLGLLIGFVVGFVMLLSSLPINEGAGAYDVYASKSAPRHEQSFDFYKYLPGNNGRGNQRQGGTARAPAPDQNSIQAPVKPVIVAASASPAVVQPAPPTGQQTAQVRTQVVPANAQIIAPTAGQPATQARDGQYAEVAANYNVQQSYFLQVGRYVVHEDAQAMRAQVLMLGLEAFIVARVEADGGTAHRVRVGPYFDQNLLTEAKKRLRRGGINYEIVRVTG